MVNPHGEQFELIRRCRKGEEQAFEELIDRYGREVWQMCFRSVGNRDDADDLSQEVWVATWRNIRSFRGDASLLTWMKQIAVNYVRQLHRKQHGHASLSLEVMDEELPALAIDLPEHLHHRQILANIEALPDALKRPLLLALRRGMPYKDIARREGCTVAAIKMRISRARAMLANTFNQEE